MKKFIPLLGLTMLLASCTDDFLSPVPQNEVTVANFYQTQEDFDRAVTGVYAGMRDWPVEIYLFLSEVRSDNYYAIFSDAQRDWRDITDFQVTPFTATVRGVWADAYTMINRANTLLERIDGVAFTNQALKAQYIAEARMLRAQAYFELVRLFGRVPLVTKPISPEEGIQIGQSEPADIYAFITKEMAEASNALPSSYTGASLGRMTKWAAKGLLAKVYLTMAGCPMQDKTGLAKAEALLQEIIGQEGGAVKWSPNYKDVFTEANENKFNLFEIQFVSGGVGAGSVFPALIVPGDLTRTLAPFGSTGGESATRLGLSDDLLAAYEPGDKRFDVTIDTMWLNTGVPPDTNNNPYVRKFLYRTTTPTTYPDWGQNFPMLRYADVLLMYAEALNEQNRTAAALPYLNKVRARAGLPALQTTSKAEFAQALLHERRIEFVGEGQRWFDLVRSCTAVQTMNDWFSSLGVNITIDQNDLLYPIPQTEMDIFPGLYTQNPGY